MKIKKPQDGMYCTKNISEDADKGSFQACAKWAVVELHPDARYAPIETLCEECAQEFRAELDRLLDTTPELPYSSGSTNAPSSLREND